MDLIKVKDLIKINTDPSRWARGIKYVNRKLVDHVSLTINENILTMEGIAESEFYNEVYHNSISIDFNTNVHVMILDLEILLKNYSYANILLPLLF